MTRPPADGPVHDLFDDVAAAVAVGETHLRRAAALGAGEDGESAEAELRAAAWYFLPAVAEGTGQPPQEVADFYHRAAVTGRPGAGPPASASLSLQRCHDRMVAALDLAGAGSSGGAALRPAVFVLRHITATPTADTEQHAARLSNLSGALLTLYRQDGTAELLDDAVAAARASVRTTDTATATATDTTTGTAPADADADADADVESPAIAAAPTEHDLAGRLMNLAGALHTRHSRAGSLEDLREALEAGRRAVALTSVPAACRARNLTNLALGLLSHFEQSDDRDALAEAVVRAREAVALVPDGPGAALPLANLSAVLGSWGSLTADADALRESVDTARRAVRCGGDALDDPEAFTLALAQALFDLHRATDDTAALDECAELCRAALERPAASHPERYRHLLTLGRALRARVPSSTEPAAVLAEAVAVLREAAAATPPGHAGRADTHGNLMLAVQDVYNGTGEAGALDEAIATGRIAVRAAGEGRPLLLKVLGNLANSLLDRHLLTRSRADLDEAVEIGRRAVAATSPGHPDEAAHLTSLAHQLLVRYQATGDLAALEESIAASRRATGVASEGSAVASVVRANLSIALVALFEANGSTEVLTEAVALRRATVSEAPAGSPALPRLLSNLTGVLRMLYEHTGDRAALEEAADCARRLVSGIAPGQPDYPLRMANAATTFHQWSALTHDDDVAQEAVTAARLAVEAVPPTHRARPALLGNQCGILLARYRRTGDLTQLADAERAAEAAVADAHPDDPDRPLHQLNLAMARRSRHERTGEPTALDACLRAAEEGLVLAPADHPLRPQLLSQISLGLQARYHRSGELRHLTGSVARAREAVAGCRPGHPDHAMYQSNLSAALLVLHQRQEPADAQRTVGEAVAAARGAVAVTERGDPDLPAHLSHLCGALMFQHGMTGGLRELAGAVTAGRRAVALSPAGHPDQTHRLANLTAAWRLRHRHDALPKALDEAVATARRAVASLAAGHPDEASVLTGCAAALRAAHRAAPDPVVLAEALDLLDRAADSAVSPVGDRTGAARALGRTALEAGEGERALAAYERAVDLLGQLAPWRLARGDREFGLGELEGLGSEAAGAALNCDDPGRAVELLEQARGVMLHQTLDMRSDLDELRAAAPGLADAFEALRARRDAADHISLAEQFDEAPGAPAEDPGRAGRRIAAERAELDTQWQALLTRIRAVRGLEGFLGRPGLATLRRQAEHGPVIMLAVSRHRADALVLTPDPQEPVVVVGLPKVTESEVIDRADRLLRGRVPGSPPVTNYAQVKQRMRDLFDLLAWQWDHVAGPVLERLGLTRALRPDDAPGSWPRIWWCPAGATAFLPWHASGHHRDDGRPDGPARTVMDRAVSSWTPTVRALAHARRPVRTPAPAPGDAAPGAVAGAAPGAAPGGGKGTLLVDMAQPAGATDPLRQVRAETAHIAGLLPDATRLEPPHNTPETVLSALPLHPVVHFACHAVSEWGSPARSGLVLSDGDGADNGDSAGTGEGDSTARLTVDAISSLHVQDAELAYLSACSTTVSNQRLADESVHITAGFLLCGYRQVIGTLWPVDDTAAGEIAMDFYSRLTGTGDAEPRTADAAHALHLALHRGRAARSWAPSHWAAHVHTGA